jgi:hypothetical protein
MLTLSLTVISLVACGDLLRPNQGQVRFVLSVGADDSGRTSPAVIGGLDGILGEELDSLDTSRGTGSARDRETAR